MDLELGTVGTTVPHPNLLFYSLLHGAQHGIIGRSQLNTGHHVVDNQPIRAVMCEQRQEGVGHGEHDVS